MTQRSELDPEMQAFLRAFEHREGCEADPEVLALVADDQPAELRALLDAYARHHGGFAVRDHNFEAYACARLSAVVESLDPDDTAERDEEVDQFDLSRAIVVGQTADGEVFHAAAWNDGDERVTIVRFRMSGVADYCVTGGFIETLRDLASDAEEPEDVDEELHELLRVGEHAEE